MEKKKETMPVVGQDVFLVRYALTGGVTKHKVLKANDWIKIEDPRGLSGWNIVPRSQIALTEEESKTKVLVMITRKEASLYKSLEKMKDLRKKIGTETLCTS